MLVVNIFRSNGHFSIFACPACLLQRRLCLGWMDTRRARLGRARDRAVWPDRGDLESLLWSADAAGGDEGLAGKPFGIVGGEKNRDPCNVVGLPSTAERRLGDDCLFKIGTDNSGAVPAIG